MSIFSRALLKALHKTYPGDGVDLIEKKINGIEFTSQNTSNFRLSKLTLATSFLGLPNRQLSTDLNADQTWLNIGKNLINYRKGAGVVKNLFRSLLLPFKLIAIPFKFASNVIKIFTEVVPLTFDKILEKLLDTSSGKKLPRYKTVFYSSLYLINKVALIVGKAITSPNTFTRKLYHSQGLMGLMLGGAVVGLVYTSLLAILVPMVTPSILVALSEVPGAVGPLLVKSAAILLHCLKQYGVFAGVITALSPQVHKLSSNFQNWWHKPSGPSETDPDAVLSQKHIEQDAGISEEHTIKPSHVKIHRALNKTGAKNTGVTQEKLAQNDPVTPKLLQAIVDTYSTTPKETPEQDNSDRSLKFGRP